MKMPRLNFVKLARVWLSFAQDKVKPYLCVLLMLSQVAWAEGEPFSVYAPAPPAGPEYAEQEALLVSQLKYRAVIDWLQKYLGNEKYRQIESLITRDFAENYILKSKKGRLAADRTQLEVSGDLNTRGLVRWLRGVETNRRGGSLRPVLILSSDLPFFSVSADRSVKYKDANFAQVYLGLLNSELQKFNVKVVPYDVSGVSLTQPPLVESDVRTLRDQSRNNTALWVNLSTCRTCGGARMDTFFYNFSHKKPLIVRSDDLVLDSVILSNTERLRNVLKPPVQQFQAEFEELVSSGALFSSTYELNIEGIGAPRVYKAIDSELSKLDFIVSATLVRAGNRAAEYEIVSTLSYDELSANLKQAQFARTNLKITLR